MPAPDRKAFWRFDGDEPTILSKERIARRPRVAEPRSRTRDIGPPLRPADAPVVLRPQFGRVHPAADGEALPNRLKSANLPAPVDARLSAKHEKEVKLTLLACAVMALAAIALVFG